MNRLERVSSIKNIYTNFEATAYLFPTMKCNLNCYMCYSGSALHQPVKDELSDEEYLVLADHLLELGYTRFDISGGEPLLRDDLLFKLIKKIRQHGGKIQLVTNGTFLIETLNKYPFQADDFDFVAVSLDSPYEEIHNRIRGYNKAYSLAVEGIKTLAAKGFTVGVNAVYLPENKDQISELLKLASNLGAAFVHILRNRLISPLLTSIETLNDLNWQSVYEGVDENLDSVPDDLLVIIALPQYIHQNLTNHLRGRYRYKNNILFRTDCIRGCGAFNQNIVITADGYVTGCVAMINEPKFRIGHIRKTPVANLLERFPDWVEQIQVRGSELTKKNICGNCMSYHFCKGGCPMAAEKFLGDWKQGDPSCNMIYQEYFSI